jgi:hypothetical protein
MRGGKCSNNLYCKFRKEEKEIKGIKTKIEGVKSWFKLKRVQYLGDKEVIVRVMLGVKKLQKERVVKN